MKSVKNHISRHNEKITKFSLENKLNDVIFSHCAEYISILWSGSYAKNIIIN
jgi:ribosomal protein L31E